MFELVCDRSPAKKTISSSSFLGWLAGRGAVKTLIDWYVRRRARRRYRNAAATKQHSMRQQWMVAGRWQSQQRYAVQCVCVCHRSSSKRAAAGAAAVVCPAEKPSESPITARPILESCRRRAAHCSSTSTSAILRSAVHTFSAWLDILSAAFPPDMLYQTLLVRCMEKICM